MKIVTQHINPPIPARFWDWQAHIEGHEENRELYGWGPTQAAAVQDLMESCPIYELPAIQRAIRDFWEERRMAEVKQ